MGVLRCDYEFVSCLDDFPMVLSVLENRFISHFKGTVYDFFQASMMFPQINDASMILLVKPNTLLCTSYPIALDSTPMMNATYLGIFQMTSLELLHLFYNIQNEIFQTPPSPLSNSSIPFIFIPKSIIRILGS
jgi:hypothetical protein